MLNKCDYARKFLEKNVTGMDICNWGVTQARHVLGSVSVKEWGGFLQEIEDVNLV